MGEGTVQILDPAGGDGMDGVGLGVGDGEGVGDGVVVGGGASAVGEGVGVGDGAGEPPPQLSATNMATASARPPAYRVFTCYSTVRVIIHPSMTTIKLNRRLTTPAKKLASPPK